ncbi:MAG: hypothetical protein ACRC3H_00895 [Lachnospiraceae bacterium]
MSFFYSYKLKKGASVPDFLLAVEKLSNEFVDDDTWADSTTFETIEDLKRFAESTEPNELAEKFYSFINLNSCKTHYFSVER